MEKGKLQDSLRPVPSRGGAVPGFRPRISVGDVFEQLIEVEVRSGRLTAWRRRRIVRYAAQLGLSAVEAGRYLDQCRDCALSSTDPVERGCTLRLITPPPSIAHHVAKFIIATAIGCLVGLLLW